MFESCTVHHTVRTRTRFFAKKGSGTFLFHKMFSMPRVCRTVNKNEQRQDTTITVTPCLLCYKDILGTIAAHKVP